MDDYEGQGLFDDEEANENEGFELTSGGKERVIYLVDCHPHMFLRTNDEEEDAKTFFDAAMEAIASDLKNKIISQASDETGLCFFNTREKKNVHGWDGIFIFQECDVPSARRIEEVSKISRDFEASIGARKQAQAATINPVYHALFTAQSMMQSASKLGVKRVLIFTNNDDPLAEVSAAEQRSMRNQTIAKAQDMADSNISIELLPMSRPGEEFDIRLLYREVMSEGEEDDPSNFIVSAQAKFEDMLSTVRKKMLKKRVQRKMSLAIAPGVEVGMNLYALIRTTRPSRAGTLDSRTQQPLKVETKFICGDTGGELDKHSIQKYYQYGGDKVVFKQDELQELRKLREPGLQLLGFKPVLCLKPYHNLSPPGFLYPSDEKITGSVKAFIALHTAMVKFQKFAVCSYMTSIRSNVKLAALVAQEQVVDDSGAQLEPAGFQLIPLPFSNDIRDPVRHHVSEVGPAPRASQEQIDRAADLLKKIDLGNTFSVVQIANPALQKHYASLQALALDEDTIPEVEDCTLPDEEGITRPVVTKAVNAFKESVYGPNWEEAEAAAATQQAKPSETAQKRKAKADLAATQQGAFNWKQLAEQGKLNTLKNEDLKTYLRANGLQLSGNKNAMIERILNHMGY